MKNIVILGSTGSIGINTLNVIEQYPDQFRVIGLSAYNNIELLENQVQKFKPQYVAVSPARMQAIKSKFPLSIKVLNVESDLDDLVSLREVDVVVIAMRGSVALKPFLSAVQNAKRVAPANKEALVVAGKILMDEARRNHAEIIPIDSEQSAIFQCLNGQNRSELKKVYLTASGGALRNVPAKKFDRFSVQEILKHPRWKMGKKITVDSATLMNKGFEVIEAKRLFDLSNDQIEVVIHPEAIIHSMVEFCDGSILAQLGVTDMRLPIQYALTFPDRWASQLKSLDFVKLKSLNFEKPDLKKFPLLKLAIDVAQKDGTLPAVLNAADEEAVEAFLNEKISLTEVFHVVQTVVKRHKNKNDPNLEEIFAADSWARVEARKVMDKI